MTRLQFNLAYWPTFLVACFLYALSNMAYDPFVGDVLFGMCAVAEIAALLILIFRLRRTYWPAWIALVVVLPWGQVVLSVITSFLSDKD